MSLESYAVWIITQRDLIYGYIIEAARGLQKSFLILYGEKNTVKMAIWFDPDFCMFESETEIKIYYLKRLPTNN